MKRISSKQSRRNSARRKRKAAARHAKAGHWSPRLEPMFTSDPVHYEVRANTDAMSFGGIGWSPSDGMRQGRAAEIVAGPRAGSADANRLHRRHRYLSPTRSFQELINSRQGDSSGRTSSSPRPRALFKPARHGGPIHWHQDNAHWRCLPANLVSCWLNLDDDASSFSCGSSSSRRRRRREPS